MTFLSAHTGMPPGSPGSVIVPCVLPRGFLAIQVRNRRTDGQPGLANTDVTVTVGGGPAQDLATDGNGFVTFVYDAAADFANVQVTVVLRVPARLWEGQESTAGAAAAATDVVDQTVTQIRVLVAGTFTLNVRVTTRRPGAAADIRWLEAWNNLAAQLSRVTTPHGGVAAAAVETDLVGSADEPPEVELTVAELDCLSSHDFSIARINGAIAASSQVRLSIDDGDALVAGAVSVVADEVDYSRQPGNVLRLVVERHGAVVNVEYFFQFEQFLIVGEGTSYEYAAGLANKYGDASDASGFKWIVATQYDVVLPAAVSTSMRVLNWADGAVIDNYNQRQCVANALAKNMIRRAVQFNAMDPLHWQNALATYGAFDACIFNNPHIGYGMHMCVVMGLTQWQAGAVAAAATARRYANKNGMAVSVYSLGYDNPPHPPLTPAQLDPLRGAPVPDPRATVESLARQHDFVRTNGAGCLDYQNNSGTAVACQFDPANSAPVNIDIQTAFTYEADRTAIAGYGAADEFADNAVRTHYTSMRNTVGLQGYLLRCYRRYGPDVLKPGGWIYINGSLHWNRELTAPFDFGVATVPAMANLAGWNGRDTFVHYNTNFTSNDHHPSWYSQWNFNPGEPGLQHARVFGRQYL